MAQQLRTLNTLAEDPGSIPEPLMTAFNHTYIIPVSGDSIPFSGLLSRQSCGVHTWKQNTHTHF